jgi:hypothetical protein
MVNGQVWIWGVWSLLASLLMSMPFRRVNILGLWLGMAWLMMWTALFLLAVITYADAVATAMVAYGSLALVNGALLLARVLDHPDSRSPLTARRGKGASGGDVA